MIGGGRSLNPGPYDYGVIKLLHLLYHTVVCVVWLLTLKAPIATKVVCFSRLLKCLRSLYGKQCGPRSDCSYRSSLFWVHNVCYYTWFICYVRQLFAADDFSNDIFRYIFFLGALRVKSWRIASKLIQLTLRVYLQSATSTFVVCW